MDVTTQPLTPLEFIFVVPIIAVPIALLVSLALLRIYRRAVMRSMERRVTPKETAGPMVVLEGARTGEPPRHLLEIIPHDPPPDRVRFAVRRATLPAAAVQVCAGLAYAIVMTSSWFFVGHLGFDWQVFLVMTIWFAWPIVIAVGLTIAVSWRGFAMLAIGYVLVFAGVATPALVDTDITAEQVLRNWLNINGFPTLLAIAFLARPIRAVGSLVLVFMVAAVGGAIFALFTFGPQGRVFYWAYLGILSGAVLLLLAGVIATGIVGWLLLRSLVGGISASEALTNWLNTNATGRFLAPVLARPISVLLVRPVSVLVVMSIISAVAGVIVVVGLFESDEQTSLLWATILKLGAVADVVLLLLVMAYSHRDRRLAAPARAWPPLSRAADQRSVDHDRLGLADVQYVAKPHRWIRARARGVDGRHCDWGLCCLQADRDAGILVASCRDRKGRASAHATAIARFFAREAQ
jgi:hypothetical protein